MTRSSHERGAGRDRLALLAAAVLHVAFVVACCVTWSNGSWWLYGSCAVVLAWLAHAALARLHEAVHGMLAKSRALNEISGIAIGTLAATPLSVYRYMHARHHAHLGGLRDPEFWPYSEPTASRARRVTYAWAELIFGWIFTPVLYSMRTARAWDVHGSSMRRRLLQEWTLLAWTWSTVLVLVHVQGWWGCFVAGHLIPAWIAGTLQTLRKFTEHLGLHGETIFSMTRTVPVKTRIRRALSASQLHVDHHAAHHRFPRIPHAALPAATAQLVAEDRDGEWRLYPSYRAAVTDALRHLADPKLGPQWHSSAAAM